VLELNGNESLKRATRPLPLNFRVLRPPRCRSPGAAPLKALASCRQPRICWKTDWDNTVRLLLAVQALTEFWRCEMFWSCRVVFHHPI
jgi:hypothetical protein